MAKMKRRRFIGVSAATLAVAAIPVLGGDAASADPRPKLGTTFYTSIWLNDRDDGDFAFKTCKKALRYVEIDRRVRLGNYTYKYDYTNERAALFVEAQGSVVGYV